MTRLLLNEGETKPHRQYVFLTPQDMSEIKANEIITIHRYKKLNNIFIKTKKIITNFIIVSFRLSDPERT